MCKNKARATELHGLCALAGKLPSRLSGLLKRERFQSRWRTSLFTIAGVGATQIGFYAFRARLLLLERRPGLMLVFLPAL